MAFRNAGEPAGRPFSYAALAAAQVIPTTSRTLITVIAANKSASPASLTVTDLTGQIGSLEVSPNDTETLFSEPGVAFTGTLTITPSAAMDVTVVVV